MLRDCGRQESTVIRGTGGEKGRKPWGDKGAGLASEQRGSECFCRNSELRNMQSTRLKWKILGFLKPNCKEKPSSCHLFHFSSCLANSLFAPIPLCLFRLLTRRRRHRGNWGFPNVFKKKDPKKAFGDHCTNNCFCSSCS